MKSAKTIQALAKDSPNSAPARALSIPQQGILAGHWMQIASLCVIGMLLVVSAHANNLDKCNGWKMTPSPDGYSFTWILQGDQTSYIDGSGTAGDPLVDPFAYVNQKIVGSGTSTVNVSLVGGNTDVIFTGSNPILPSYHFTYGGIGNGNPHFGLVEKNGGPPNFDIVSEQWNGLSASSAISVDQPASGKKYEVIYAVSTDGSNQTGTWYEVPYSGKFTFKNYGSDKVTLSSVGYFTTSTQIPLDNLNFGNTPPPGYSGSQFTQLTQYDGQTVSSGGSIDVVTPEPSMLIPLAGAFAGLLTLRRRPCFAS